MTEEEVKKIAELSRKIDLKVMVTWIAKMTEEYGRFLETLGGLEKESTDAFEAVKTIGRSPAFIEKIVEDSPPELVGSFMKMMLKLAVVDADMKRITELPGDEKIRVGRMLQTLASEYRNLLEMAKKKSVKKNV